MLTEEQKNSLPKTALIDADWMIYRVGFASEEDEEKYAKARLTELVTDIVFFELGCDGYETYLTGSANYRYEIATTVPYKGNRATAKRPKHYDALREHMQRLGAEVMEGIEADDKVAMRMAEGEFVLVGVDKDLLQIPGHHWNPIRQEYKFVTEFEGLYSFYTQLLVGDRSDNIKGLWKVGPVKAEKILKGCETEQELYEACLKAYLDHNETLERLLENGRLLWLQRKEGELWSPPVEAVECEAEGQALAAEG